MDDAIVKDIGRKCSDDVAAAIRRNMLLMGDAREKVIVAAYGATAAFGAASGAFAAMSDGPAEMDAANVDAMWAAFIRPMILGDFARAALQAAGGKQDGR